MSVLVAVLVTAAASSTASASPPAVTVTDCAVFQFCVVNVSELVPTVTAALSLATATVTFAEGAVSSTTA